MDFLSSTDLFFKHLKLLKISSQKFGKFFQNIRENSLNRCENVLQTSQIIKYFNIFFKNEEEKEAERRPLRDLV